MDDPLLVQGASLTFTRMVLRRGIVCVIRATAERYAGAGDKRIASNDVLR